MIQMRSWGIVTGLCIAALVLDTVGGDGPTAVVLLGPSGSGKSQTGNTLLTNERFTVSAGLESETRKPQGGLVTYEGREWQIVDTPGYLDTSLAPGELDELLAQFADVVSDRIAALVFVVPYGRFGDAHMRAWRLVRGAFGGLALKYMALAFTNCGDRSEADVRSEIARLCSNPTPPAVCAVVGQLEDSSRVLAFGKLEAERRALDRTKLFELAAKFENVNGGRGYNHGDFLRTRARRKLLAKRVEAITSAEDRRLLDVLLSNVESGAQSDEDLLHALERAEGLGETKRVVLDFEDRTLGPFYQVGSGWRQPMPVPYDSMRGYSTGSGSGGRLFVHTGTDSGVRLRHGDKRLGELRTPLFFLGSGEISWEATGSGGFIALCPADSAAAPTSGCLERRIGRQSLELSRGSFDEHELMHLRGSAVHLRIVDDKTNGWGFVALDNLAYPFIVLANGNSTENATGFAAASVERRLASEMGGENEQNLEAAVSSDSGVPGLSPPTEMTSDSKAERPLAPEIVSKPVAENGLSSQSNEEHVPSLPTGDAGSRASMEGGAQPPLSSASVTPGVN